MSFLNRHHWVLLITLLLSGCASRNVDWDYNPARSLIHLKSYSWYQPTTDNNPAGYNDQALVQQRIRSAANNFLQLRGYQQIPLAAGNQPTGKVDFLIHETMTVSTNQEELQTTHVLGYGPIIPPWRTGLVAETRIRRFDESTVNIDIIDPGTNQLIWRGRSWFRVDKTSTPEQRTAKIDEAVQQILSGFPRPSPTK